MDYTDESYERKKRRLRIEQEAEQSRAKLIDEVPTFWYNVYRAFEDRGFDEKQSFELLKEFIHWLGSFDS